MTVSSLKIQWNDRKQNRKRLTELGYCSRQYLNKRLLRSDVLMIDKAFKDEDSLYRLIRVNTAGSITYWYKIEDVTVALNDRD